MLAHYQKDNDLLLWISYIINHSLKMCVPNRHYRQIEISILPGTAKQNDNSKMSAHFTGTFCETE